MVTLNSGFLTDNEGDSDYTSSNNKLSVVSVSNTYVFGQTNTNDQLVQYKNSSTVRESRQKPLSRDLVVCCIIKVMDDKFLAVVKTGLAEKEIREFKRGLMFSDITMAVGTFFELEITCYPGKIYQKVNEVPKENYNIVEFVVNLNANIS